MPGDFFILLFHSFFVYMFVMEKLRALTHSPKETNEETKTNINNISRSKYILGNNKMINVILNSIFGLTFQMKIDFGK